MASTDRVALLRSLELFDQYPEERLRGLSSYLEPVSLADGDEVFSEGTPGDGMYFVVSGRVRVTKKLSDGGKKDLASLGPGDCLGEMALLDAAKRSAGAYASGPCELLRLKRDDLKKWLAADPALAMQFFAELVSVQSRRLRRTSSELALMQELSTLLVEPASSPVSLLDRALSRVVPHLDGEWSACAHAYNPYNEEMDPAGALGPEAFGPEAGALPSKAAPERAWADERTLVLVLRAPTKLLGSLRFRAAAAPDENRKAEADRTLASVARLLTSALENLDFRADEALRRRLQARNDAQSF
ncbi:MAG: cyclic nucleotide-binding domain-containing protein [Elusimicrobiota bacterium]|nr:MAG: cyclic nucleotide-binding domain-containing protein [Elusimicrobiota bacterium]